VVFVAMKYLLSLPGPLCGVIPRKVRTGPLKCAKDFIRGSEL